MEYQGLFLSQRADIALLISATRLKRALFAIQGSRYLTTWLFRTQDRPSELMVKVALRVKYGASFWLARQFVQVAAPCHRFFLNGLLIVGPHARGPDHNGRR